MKKIFSALTLSILLSPSFVFGVSPLGVPSSKESPRQPSGAMMHREDSTQGGINPMHLASSTRASSTRPLNDFCSHIDMIIVAIDGKITTSQNTVNDRVTKKEIRHDEIQSRIDTLREQHNNSRKVQIDELNKRITSNEELEAVKSFVASMDKALTIKNTAVDALLASYKKEAGQATTTKKAAIDQALKTLALEINTAKTKAKNDCAHGVEGNLVRTNLKNTLQKAQENFKNTVVSTQKMKDTTEILRKEKKDELKKIEKDFKSSLEQARLDLKHILKNKNSTATSATSH